MIIALLVIIASALLFGASFTLKTIGFLVAASIVVTVWIASATFLISM